MGNLVNDFAGRIDGELIRAADWNGLIAAIEARLGVLETTVNTRLDALSATVATLNATVSTLQGRVTPLEALATALRSRLRRVDLQATRSSFAVGERAEIVARVTDIEGRPLDLSNAATRPWVDFVTVWGALKAAPGFESRGGAGDRSIAVRVNASGEARVLLRAEAGAALAEEQEQEVAGVLATTISGSMSVAQAILAAPTPASTQVAPAYQMMTTAYERRDTVVMRNYIDTHYVYAPVQVMPPVQAVNWRDHHATVLAFVKPDDSPLTADGAQASGSIRVTFRDWVGPWVVGVYTPSIKDKADRFAERLRGLVWEEYDRVVGGVWGILEPEIVNAGIIGRHRDYAAMREAVEGLRIDNPPIFFEDLKQTVTGGLVLEQALVFGQSAAPAMVQGTAAGKAVGCAAAQGQKAAERAAAEPRAETRRTVAAAETSIGAQVAAQVQGLANQVVQVQKVAEFARMEIGSVNTELRGKAGLEMVSRLLEAGRG